MRHFIIFGLIFLFTFTGATDVYGPIELEPEGEPHSDLNLGSKEEVIPHCSNDTVQSRIVKGAFASDKQLPYQVGLLIGFKDNKYAWCGGTIIGNEWLITAAHCTYGARSIEVRLGSIWSQNPLRISWGYQNHVHGDWTTQGRDVALVKMQWVDYNENMAPAALPPRNGHYSQYVNSRVVASGWGGINDNGQGSDRLKYVVMSVIDGDNCARYYGEDAKRPNILCSLSDEKGNICSGDSGGPLVLEHTRTLVGVVAFGAANACTLGYPAGFQRITYYLDWIKDISGISW